MENNFNLKKFLVENKLTANSRMLKENASIDGKKVDLDSLEVEGIHRDDFPDFVDAYIVGAEFEDGTPLTGEQVEKFNMEYPEYIQEFIHDRQLYSENTKQIKEESGDKGNYKVLYLQVTPDQKKEIVEQSRENTIAGSLDTLLVAKVGGGNEIVLTVDKALYDEVVGNGQDIVDYFIEVGM